MRLALGLHVRKLPGLELRAIDVAPIECRSVHREARGDCPISAYDDVVLTGAAVPFSEAQFAAFVLDDAGRRGKDLGFVRTPPEEDGRRAGCGKTRTSSSMRGRRKRAIAQRACALLYRSLWLVKSYLDRGALQFLVARGLPPAQPILELLKVEVNHGSDVERQELGHHKPAHYGQA